MPNDVWQEVPSRSPRRLRVWILRGYRPDGHLKLFFDNKWNCSYDIVSYGHDIKASWLIHEAALVLGDEDLLRRIKELVLQIASAAGEGFTKEGGMIYEKTVPSTEMTTRPASGNVLTTTGACAWK